MMAQRWFGPYHLIMFLLMVTTAECENCVTKDNIKAVLKSAVTLTCPLTQKPTQVIWEVVHGETIEKVTSVSNCSSTCTIDANNNMGQRPSCKVRAVQDLEKGTESLIISPVENTDAVWYRCTVQNGTGSYCSELKINVQDEPQHQILLKDCDSSGPFEAVLNSTLMLQCPVDRLHPDTPQIIWGKVEEDLTVPITRCPSRCVSGGAQKPLCERAKTMENGSLIISPVEYTDSLWFWCAVNSTSCHKFKLNVQDKVFPDEKSQAEGDSHGTQNPEEQTHFSNGTENSPNATGPIITSAGFAFLFLIILSGTIVWFRKKKSTLKVESENCYEVLDEVVHNDGFQYSLVQFEPASMYTFKGK